jgi:hypothetical protein
LCKNFRNSLYEPLKTVGQLNLMHLVAGRAGVVVVDMAGVRLGGRGGTVEVAGVNIVEGGMKGMNCKEGG